MKLSEQQTIELMALSAIPKFGVVTIRNLISYCGGISEVFAKPKKHLFSIPGIGQQKAKLLSSKSTLDQAEKEYQKAQKQNVDIITYLDDKFPSKLKEYEDAPLFFYTKGEFNPNPHRTVAIIGTRQATPYGKNTCEKIIEDLTNYNATIISGLAYGIDTTAHRKAVEKDIYNIAVLGNGLNDIYPAENRSLAKRILDNGAIISEFALETMPLRENFPKRNRIIAGLADVVIVVESARKGGSMITVEYANSYNKDVFAVPGKLHDQFSEGCNHLIKTHKAHLLTNVEDIAYIMRWEKGDKPVQPSLFPDLTSAEQSIIDHFETNKSIHLDKLHYITKIPLSKLITELLSLEFKGIIKSLPGKNYILI